MNSSSKQTNRILQHEEVGISYPVLRQPWHCNHTSSDKKRPLVWNPNRRGHSIRSNHPMECFGYSSSPWNHSHIPTWRLPQLELSVDFHVPDLLHWQIDEDHWPKKPKEWSFEVLLPSSHRKCLLRSSDYISAKLYTGQPGSLANTWTSTSRRTFGRFLCHCGGLF